MRINLFVLVAVAAPFAAGAQLSLEEKVALLCTSAPVIERLKIPVMNGWNQSLHSVVWTKPKEELRGFERISLTPGIRRWYLSRWQWMN